MKKKLENEVSTNLKRKTEFFKKEKAITLIALILTIIILLILAGITISAITGDNGIIGNAGKAKEEAEIANEKEIIEKATVQAIGNNKYGNIEENELQSELNKETGEGKTEATKLGEEFEIAFIDTKRYYTVDIDGNIVEEGKIVEDKSPGDMTKDENGNTLKGDETEPYEIWCIEDLVEWSNNYKNYQNVNIILCRNLNFKSKYSYADSETTDYGDLNQDKEIESLINEMQKGIGFIPITQFLGVFDGKNNSLINIYEKTSGVGGIFAEINNATICNLKVNGIMYSNDTIGGIVGIVKSGKFINCTVDVKIEGNGICTGRNCWLGR